MNMRSGVFVPALLKNEDYNVATRLKVCSKYEPQR